MSQFKKMDFSKIEDFTSVMEKYGGEEYLKENFPHILQMLYNTREWHMKQGVHEVKEGYQDAFNVYELPLTGVTKNAIDSNGISAVWSRSEASLTQPVAFIHMNSVVEDPVKGHLINAYAGYEQNVQNVNYDFHITRDMLQYTQDSKRVRTTTEFDTVTKIGGKSVMTSGSVTRSMDIDLVNLTSVIKDINVRQPVPKDSKKENVIRVVYNGRTDERAAYNFEKATRRKEGNTYYVKVFYPFLIDVELDDIYEFDANAPVSFGQGFELSMASEVVKGGRVYSNMSVVDKIKTTVQGNKLTVDFAYAPKTDDNYWYVEMPLTAEQTGAEFSFHLQFRVNYKIKGSGSGNTYHTSVLVTTESTEESPNKALVSKANIVWGCLGKDTRIRTEDGYRKISDIKVGDKLFTDKGYISLKNMVTGREERVVAVSVSDDAILYITPKHPVASGRGIICADELMAGDELRMEDGTFKEITYLEMVAYNDTVYSPELEESALISAEGIMVGDYLTPIDVKEEAVEEPEPLEPELLKELIRWSELQKEKLLNAGR